jgi:hypothetical protein
MAETCGVKVNEVLLTYVKTTMMDRKADGVQVTSQREGRFRLRRRGKRKAGPSARAEAVG